MTNMMVSVIFCDPCGEKRVKDVKDKLQALLTSSSRGDDYCFICNKELTSDNLKATDENVNNLSTGQSIDKDDNDDFVTVNLNKPAIKIEALVNSDVPNKSALVESAHDPVKLPKHLHVGNGSNKFKGRHMKKEEVSESEDDQNERIGDTCSSDETYEYDSDDDINGGTGSDYNDVKSIGIEKEFQRPQFERKTIVHDAVNALQIDAIQPELSKMLEIIDDPDKPYKCKECSQQYRTLRFILRHFCVHIGKSEKSLTFYQCNKCCDKNFNSFPEWSEHTEQFICKYQSCGDIMKSRASLAKHEKIHKKEGHEKIYNKGHEKIHKKEGNKLIKCKVCGDEFASYYKLRAHKHKAHAGVQLNTASGKKKLGVQEKEDDEGDKGNATANAIEDWEIVISSLKPDVLKVIMDESYKGIDFKCKFCDKFMAKIGNFLAHLVEHVDDKHLFAKPFRCNSCCDKTFETYLEWSRHVKPYKCEVVGCQVSVDSRCRINHHLKRTHAERKIPCPECSMLFKHQVNLDNHMKNVHVRSNDFTCSICGKQYSTRGALVSHERKHKFNSTKPFKCDCGRVFSSPKLLKLHQMNHTGERPYQCEQCGFRTKTKRDLLDHQFRHSDTKPYQCEICGKQMTHPTWYKRHMQIHTGAKMLKCRYCDERFKYHVTRIRHERIHPEAKGTRFVCNVCGKDMITQNRLQRHTRVHTGEKPFQCTLCEFRTHRPECLKNHQKRHLKDKVSESHTKILKVSVKNTLNETRREEFVNADVQDIQSERQNLALQADEHDIHSKIPPNLARLKDDVNAIRDAERRNIVQHELTAISEARIASAYVVL